MVVSMHLMLKLIRHPLKILSPVINTCALKRHKFSNILMKWTLRFVYDSHARLDHRSTKQLFNYPSTLCV